MHLPEISIRYENEATMLRNGGQLCDRPWRDGAIVMERIDFPRGASILVKTPYI